MTQDDKQVIKHNILDPFRSHIFLRAIDWRTAWCIIVRLYTRVAVLTQNQGNNQTI